MTFGNKLLLLRKRKGMSQDNLSEKMNVSRQTVSKWELDEMLPDVNNLIKLADVFHVSAEYLCNEQIEDIKHYGLPTMHNDINKYDCVNFLAAVSSSVISVIAVFYYSYVGVIQFRYYRQWDHEHYQSIYWPMSYYEAINEFIVIIILIIIIVVSLHIAKKIYRKVFGSSDI